jgi:hypothetical protein
MKKKLFLFASTALAFILAILPEYFLFLCENKVYYPDTGESYCSASYFESLRITLLLLSLALAPIVSILLFTREAVFNAYLRFSIFALPIFGYFLFVASTVGGGGGGTLSMGGGIPGEFAIGLVAFIYFVISMFVIARKSSQFRDPDAERRDRGLLNTTEEWSNDVAPMDFHDIDILKSAISEAREIGKTDAEVAATLQEQGWKTTDIDKAFAELNREPE